MITEQTIRTPNFAGDVEDGKPSRMTGAVNGSRYREMDATNGVVKEYRYNESKDEWVPDDAASSAEAYADAAEAAAERAEEAAASVGLVDYAYLDANAAGEAQVTLCGDKPATPGAIVTFDDGAAVPAKSATIGIEPVQDLHGQANPWPAGGGKNIIPYPYRDADGTYSGVPFSTDSVGKITASGTNNAGLNYYLMGATTLPAGTYTLSATGPHEGCGLIAYNSDAGAVLANIAGSSASTSATFTLAADTNIVLYFNAGASARAININCYVQLESGSTATPFAPYENVCPITGWTGANITANNANLYEPVWPPDITGTYAGFAMPFKDKDFFVTLTDNDPTADISGCFFGLTTNGKDANGGYKWLINGGSVLDTNYQNSQWHYGYMSVYPANETTLNKIKARFNIMLTPLSAEPYVPKVTNTVAVSWQDVAGTVYGGNLEYLGDKKWRLTVPDGHNSFSAFDTFAQGSSFAYGSLALTGAPSTGGAYADDVVTSALKVNTDPAAYSCRRIDAKLYCFFPLGTTQAEAEALIAGMDTVYPLATPLVYDLTADELATLLGNNVVFADTGAIAELTYRTSENSRTIVLGTGLDGLFEAKDGIITSVENRVPEPPAEDGDYKLTATVADGVVSYSWTEEA